MVTDIFLIYLDLDPVEDYSPSTKNSKLLRSERKNNRKDKMSHSTKNRVTFSAEKEPTKSRVEERKIHEYEEKKTSMNPDHKSILKKSVNPLYNGSVKRKLYGFEYF
jgi:hypothetical protein